MQTTTRRISLCLTLEMEIQLRQLQKTMGENQSQVIKRAIMLLYRLATDKDIATGKPPFDEP